MVRDAVRDWVEKSSCPFVAAHHRRGHVPTGGRQALGEMGVFGATLKGDGCAGSTNVAYGLIMQELERGDSGLRSSPSVQGRSSCTRSTPRLGGAEGSGCQAPVRREPRCFGLTEPDHGSDPAPWPPARSRRATEYVLNAPSSGSPTARWPRSGGVGKGVDGEIAWLSRGAADSGFSTLDIHGSFDARVDHLWSSPRGLQDPPQNKLPGVNPQVPLGCPLPGAYGIAWGPSAGHGLL